MSRLEGGCPRGAGGSDELTDRADRGGDEQGGGQEGADEGNCELLHVRDIEGHCHHSLNSGRTIRRMQAVLQGACKIRETAKTRHSPIRRGLSRDSATPTSRKLSQLSVYEFGQMCPLPPPRPPR